MTTLNRIFLTLNGEITDVYEVGVDGVKEIRETTHGGESSIIFRIEYEDGELLYVGYPKEEHEERMTQLKEESKLDFQKQLSFGV